MQQADRIKNLPPYLFAEIDKMINKAKQEGVDVISFGVGDPDRPTPEHIVESMIEAVRDPSTHSYPSYEGLLTYREAVAGWYQKRFGVELDPEDEVVSLIGSKEGIAHFPFCYINPGDLALIPDPGYPVYKTAVLLAGGEVETLPLKKENNYLVELDEISPASLERAKLLYLNYPNNPTAALATREFFQKVVALAKEYDFIVAHDSAYSEVYLEEEKPLSFLEIAGARDIAIEFGSLSKSFNMTGWRCGWAVGNENLIESLGRIKTNIDSGIFEAVQKAGITALTSEKTAAEEMRHLYRQRRDRLVTGLKDLGWKVSPNQASFYIWAEVPPAYENGEEFSRKVFQETGVFFTPGIGYGQQGDKFVRLALTVSQERTEEALERLSDSSIFN